MKRHWPPNAGFLGFEMLAIKSYKVSALPFLY